MKIAFLNSRKVFFYCTNHKDGAGTIRYSRYPFQSSKEIYEVEAHSKGINRLAITHDDNYMFSVGEEG
jgi:uncharacterized pyridoxamine 5'-phosphate oxidase family protein